MTYSTDTREATPGVALTLNRQGLAATGNSTHGYFGGGWGPSSFYRYSTMDRITYSTSTYGVLPSDGSLSNKRSGLAATSARANGLPQSTATVANSI